ncbi:tRNA-splicing endonuclease subunit Sen34-like [Asterias rubens]|uniref:tRNA-splicing endonuclease subunit Sen34-like n=1 Tax=Asterias rubens TaxID=7604 RepID=UPI001455D576|nr:tRNA-splicing endonuclease subunit Sen34-like [Asterias rubens]
MYNGSISSWESTNAGVPQDVKILREKHHIIGSLTGSLPRSPRQNTQLGLPLQLLPEEAAVLIEYDAARFVTVSVPTPSCQDVSIFKEAREQSFQEQQALWESQKLQKKEQFAAIISSGRTTKKHRRAERAKKQKREKSLTISLPSVISKDAADKKILPRNEVTLFQTDSEVRKIYHTEETLSQAGECSYHKDKSASDLEQECVSVECSVVSDDKEQNIPSLLNHNTVTNTWDSHLHASSVADKTCTNIRSRQDAKPVTGSTRVIEQSLNGTSEKLIIPAAESSYEINLKLQVSKSNSSLTSQDVSTDSEGANKKITKEIPPDAKNCDISSASFISFKGNRTNCVGYSNQEMMPTTVDSMLSQYNENSVTHGVTLNAQDVPSGQTDDLMSSESKTNQETLPSEGREDHNVSTVSLGKGVTEEAVFKKPSDPEPSSGYMVHLVTASSTTPRQDVTDLTFLISTPQEMLRYKIFKDLWETGYYLTSGCKFGGDFLVYPGDPFLYHSYFIAVCIPYQRFLSPLDLITYGRLATNVKKTVIICSINGDDDAVYTSLQWTGLS